MRKRSRIIMIMNNNNINNKIVPGFFGIFNNIFVHSLNKSMSQPFLDRKISPVFTLLGNLLLLVIVVKKKKK